MNNLEEKFHWNFCYEEQIYVDRLVGFFFFPSMLPYFSINFVPPLWRANDSSKKIDAGNTEDKNIRVGWVTVNMEFFFRPYNEVFFINSFLSKRVLFKMSVDFLCFLLFFLDRAIDLIFHVVAVLLQPTLPNNVLGHIGTPFLSFKLST